MYKGAINQMKISRQKRFQRHKEDQLSWIYTKQKESETMYKISHEICPEKAVLFHPLQPSIVFAVINRTFNEHAWYPPFHVKHSQTKWIISWIKILNYSFWNPNNSSIHTWITVGRSLHCNEVCKKMRRTIPYQEFFSEREESHKRGTIKQEGLCCSWLS